MTSGPVRLEVPPAPQYLSAARLVAGAMAADAGLTVDDLEDLRLGVDELLSVLIAGVGEVGADGVRIALEYVVDEGTITVRGAVDGVAVNATPDALTARILAAVADHYELRASSFEITKSSSLREPS
jgi:anti-sigma regulatory factor (Ser/Thr protein kinase)